MGVPAGGYPWHWAIYAWIEGESAATAPIINLCDFAQSLAQFLIALQQIDPTGGPRPGPYNFYRGGSLHVYDSETRQALVILKDKIDVEAATEVWETSLATTWQDHPVWLHGIMNP
jgi:aminoglycoside phosphotransferase (APT) family kinase protein